MASTGSLASTLVEGGLKLQVTVEGAVNSCNSHSGGSLRHKLHKTPLCLHKSESRAHVQHPLIVQFQLLR